MFNGKNRNTHAAVDKTIGPAARKSAFVSNDDLTASRQWGAKHETCQISSHNLPAIGHPDNMWDTRLPGTGPPGHQKSSDSPFQKLKPEELS